MDPFSILAGTAGLADVSWRLLKYLVNVKAASASIQEEIVTLEREIESLVTTNESVEELYHSRQEANDCHTTADKSKIENLWSQLKALVTQSHDSINRLERLLEDVIGKQGPRKDGKLDGLRKTIRKQGRDGEYMEIRQRLAINQNLIQIMLSALNIAYTHKIDTARTLAFSELSTNMQQLYTNLQIKVNTISREVGRLTNTGDLDNSLASVKAVVTRISFNEHWNVPHNVSSYYTGRQKELEDLQSTLNVAQSRERQDHQKRFVIYGLGGSGKTQFCVKFAQDNREHYWAVLWVNGSSYEHAQHSYEEIAKLAGLEPNENAAKYWLSSLQQPWLLLIDNVDNPEIDVMRLCPSGERGVILITTRNPSNKIHGTEGSGFLHLERLEAEEASDLVLAAAFFPRPWEIATRKYAKRIAHMLGYLPLALIHAGKAILDKLCLLSDYPEYYERTWDRIRRARSRSIHRSSQETQVSDLTVWSSYEMIYVGLRNKTDQRSRDALELITMFSFFYWENIDYDMIKAAAMNPRREQEDARAKVRAERLNPIHLAPKTWTVWFRDWVMALLAPLTKPCVTLPAVLRDEDDIPFDEDRLRSALSLLVGLGMLTLVDENNSYSMHPLVHKWVRERPDTSMAEQTVWCQAAATVLAESIFYQAPSTYAVQDELLKRRIYPHVESVRRFQEDLENRLEDQQRSHIRKWPFSWPLFRPSFGRLQAVEYAKFSLVYLYCGRWDEAEKLQLKVKDWVFAKLGPDSEPGIRIALLLSTCYRLQTRNNRARQLQYEALDFAKRYYGPDHPKTLEIMDTLGTTCLLCSRLREASQLHQAAVEKLLNLEGFGPEHEATLIAIHNLAKTKLRYFDYEEAFRLQTQAYEGLQKRLGSTHEKTLEAKDNLAFMYGFKGERYLPTALQISEEVLETRSRILGREHPLTLMSGLTVVQIKTAMNMFDEAEQALLDGLPVAERNLGETHLGTLTGRTWLAHLYWRQGRYLEAQTILEDVVKKQNYVESKRADGEHFDRSKS
ncbi:tetratricopeptide repeat domain-containing protein [Aspergillus desertorum]